MELSLSPLIIVGIFCLYPNASYKFCNQHASQPASDNAMYSASMDNNTIVVCFLDHHVITPPSARKMYADVDFKSLVFAYAASAKLYVELAPKVVSDLWYVISNFFVPARYQSILFRAVLCCRLGFAV